MLSVGQLRWQLHLMSFSKTLRVVTYADMPAVTDHRASSSPWTAQQPCTRFQNDHLRYSISGRKPPSHCCGHVRLADGRTPGMGCFSSKTAGDSLDHQTAIAADQGVGSVSQPAASATLAPRATDEVSPRAAAEELREMPSGHAKASGDGAPGHTSCLERNDDAACKSKFRLARQIGSGSKSQIFEAYHRKEGTRYISQAPQ